MASGGIRVVHIYPIATVPIGYARELIISLLLVSCVDFRTKLSVTSENVSTIDRTKPRGMHKSYKLIISDAPTSLRAIIFFAFQFAIKNRRRKYLTSTCLTPTIRISNPESRHNGDCTSGSRFGEQMMGNIPSSILVSCWSSAFKAPQFWLTLSDPAEIEKLAKEKLSQAGW